MNYCKSKRGYFYKIIGDKKIRISIQEYKLKMKGGRVESDGKLESSDFEKSYDKSYDSSKSYHGLPQSYSQITDEMLNNIVLKVLRKPFYLAGEPVIFFGGKSANNFTHACHNDSIISKKINFFVLKHICAIPTTIEKILTIDLIELFYGLKNIRKKNSSFMNRLYNILESEFMKIKRFQYISGINFANRNKIKELIKFSGPDHISSNQIKQSVRTLTSLTNNPNEILTQLQIIKQKTNELSESHGEVEARKYQQEEFKKIINLILQKKLLKGV